MFFFNNRKHGVSWGKQAISFGREIFEMRLVHFIDSRSNKFLTTNKNEMGQRKACHDWVTLKQHKKYIEKASNSKRPKKLKFNKVKLNIIHLSKQMPVSCYCYEVIE